MVRNSDGYQSDPGYDAFPPPQEPTEVECIHCGSVYQSTEIVFRLGEGPGGEEGAWCCPVEGCDGVGFLFDIWPTDPEWRDEDGNKVCHFFDDDDEEDEEGEEDASMLGGDEVDLGEGDRPRDQQRGPRRCDDSGVFGDEDIPF